MKGQTKKVCPTFLIDTEAATHATVLKTIERFTLAGDFRVNDIDQRDGDVVHAGPERGKR